MAQTDPNFPLRPKSNFPWPLVAIVAAALILAAFIYYLPRAPKREGAGTAAQVPQQPFGQTIQMKDLKLQPAPTGGSVYIQGQVANAGSKKVNGVLVVGRFYDSSGNVVHQDTVPMQVVPKNSANTVPVSFAEDPLAPNASTEFRVAFDNLPANWNHEMPELEIAQVGYVGGNPAESAQNPNLPGAPKMPIYNQNTPNGNVTVGTGSQSDANTGAANGQQQLPASDVTPVTGTTGKPSPMHAATGTHARHKRHAKTGSAQPAGSPQ